MELRLEPAHKRLKVPTLTGSLKAEFHSRIFFTPHYRELTDGAARPLRYVFHQLSSWVIQCTLFQWPPMLWGWPAYWIIWAGMPRRLRAKYICSPSS